MALITSAQAARRLGVKVESLYAYVSRGLLERRGVDGDRRSLFDADEVERLARRGRPRQATRPGPLSIDIETAITSVHADGHRYRGRSALELAGCWTFEQVAEWLWFGTHTDAAVRWPVPLWAVGADGSTSVLGPAITAEGHGWGWRLRVPTLVAAHAQIHSTDGVGLDTVSVAHSGRALIAAVVSLLPAARGGSARLVLDDGSVHSGTVAGALWNRLGGPRPTPALVSTLNAALVLMADHELATSTLAARVAASTRAAPMAVVSAGLGALAGPLHGGESGRAAVLLADVAEHGVDDAVAGAMHRHGRVPGFGHRLYPDGDPRATSIIERLRSAVDDRHLAAYDALVDRIGPLHGHANCDLALAAFVTSTRMDPTAGELIFTVARIAGWLAHAIEEYAEAPLRYRPRATYVGP